MGKWLMSVVIYQEHQTRDGKKLIQATLNSEKSLNALSQPMIESLLTHLNLWQDDDSVVAILLDSVGDKAFCAGGDIVELYHAMAQQPNQSVHYVEQFFTMEYSLDYLIHTYSKPIIVWGNGFVMGGGLGLMAGASHRVVTERSRVAMPEVSIGLYPDVGATYFLNNMPDRLGLFLGLTAAQMNASDCLKVKLADHFLLHQQKQQLISAIVGATFDCDPALKISELIEIIAKESISELPQGNIESHQELLNEVLSGQTLLEVVNAIKSLRTEDKWLSKAQSSLNRGSAISACILERQLLVGQKLSLKECFELELSLSVRCGELGEFREGVRALLIEKDNKPQWIFEHVNDVDSAVIEQLFNPIWNEYNHPLKAL
ncbi:MAG: enoyl-CoA hydratase/isomerase family protein [Gammaproteobacteria bacterium]|nr:enoyl-CoA hydratase/isomerase family protein [Gammaproteobacteria bacterium]